MLKFSFLLLAGLSVAVLLAACTEVGYYAQCVNGHWDVMRRCRPIDDLAGRDLVDQMIGQRADGHGASPRAQRA